MSSMVYLVKLLFAEKVPSTTWTKEKKRKRFSIFGRSGIVHIISYTLYTWTKETKRKRFSISGRSGIIQETGEIRHPQSGRLNTQLASE